ncbi:MAG: glycosyl hydrolase 115 family protein, partial [Bacteroidaceae bacterium]|nr:glycosyl hydrolase 115 family protein [Bacteroidaceae bacterium]
MKYTRVFLLASVAITIAFPLSGQSLELTSDPASASFILVGQKDTTCIVVDAEDAEVVRTAAACLAADLEAVAGAQVPVYDEVRRGSMPILAGTLGSSPLVDRLLTQGILQGVDIRGKWECFGMQVVEQPMSGIERALVVYGSTPRGTAYGLLELSRMMGVSPWIWWADVVPRHRPELYLSGSRMESSEPSVRYRGIFLNDEDWGLEPWAATKMDKSFNNIGPNAYARIMELLLRLRGNTLWPAMHPCSRAFWDLKENLPVARKYDIMLGSSHCEQMLRDNEWEWRRAPWNGTNEDWDYPSNKTKIQQYWAERVGESRGFSAMYTLGMRGVHDWGISGYPSTDDKVRGLSEIIAYQRQLLRDSIGDPATIPQLFIPYKEVLEAYNAGLQVPEDVTLCWVDDNHGYIRQMPKQQEQARSGGNGIYYHISYWG